MLKKNRTQWKKRTRKICDSNFVSGIDRQLGNLTILQNAHIVKLNQVECVTHMQRAV